MAGFIDPVILDYFQEPGFFTGQARFLIDNGRNHGVGREPAPSKEGTP
jgi:hypothetical protein